MNFYVHTGNGVPTGPWLLENIAEAVLAGQLPTSAWIATHGEREWLPMTARTDVMTALSELQAKRSAPPPPITATAGPPGTLVTTPPTSTAPGAKPAKKEEPLRDPVGMKIAAGIFAAFMALTMLQLLVIAFRADPDAKPAPAAVAPKK